MNPTPPKEDNYLDVSCPTCGAVPKHGHLCTPPKDVEGIEAAIKIEVENCGGDTALLTRNLTNLITTHTDRRVREAIKQTVACFDTHDEGFGDYCDTGSDMEWACRSECVEHGKKRARRLYKALDQPKEERINENGCPDCDVHGNCSQHSDQPKDL